MTYARPLTILAILGISTASLYAYTYKTPEERIIESIRIQNQAIEEANSAKIDSYRAILDKCYKTATGSSREILEKLDACKDIQKPELQMIINYSGSIERVSKGNNNVEESTATGGVIPVPLWNSIKWKSNPIERELLGWLQVKICWKQINSPLCKDKELLSRLYKITEDRIPWKNMFPILIWITNAESSLGLNFAKDIVGGRCDWRNNLGGIKWKINDDKSREYTNNNKFWYSYSKNKPADDFWCYLYPFDSIDDYWISKTNSIRFWYKGCIDSSTPIDCIWRTYVKWDWKSKPSWNNNVAYFLN